MKNLFLSVVTMLMAFAVQASALEEARIYINAGHGSWGPNDRPCATITYPNLAETGRPDTCGFYESNTNMWKALALGRTLEYMGAEYDNIMYSRVKNGPYPYVSGAEDEYLYNRSLSEICEEVDANNMDFFISIHSNAATDGSTYNYTLFLYRGEDGGNDYAEGSYDMSVALWDRVNAANNGIEFTSHYKTTTNIRGDIDFYGSSSTRYGTYGNYTGYLGVLKHGCPGLLSEGYFHTYQPARHRALNEDFCFQEGVRYARGIADYYGAEGETTGYIMGTIKDMHELISMDYFTYAVGTNDQYLPLNGATVNLYKGGELVETYTCDGNYNGVFVFEHLEPSDDYTLDYICDGYKAATEEYSGAIEVVANETTYVQALLESESYIEPEAPEFEYENYPDPEQDADISTSEKYNMTEVISSAAVSDLDGKTIRRSILRNGELYVLAVDGVAAPYLYIIDPETGATTKTLSTEGTQGEYYALSDIAFTADDVLIGCNMEECQYTPEGTFRVYKWDDLDAKPIQWFTSQKSGNYYNANVGVSLAVTGDSQNCTIITSAKTINGSTIRMLFTDIVNGEKSTEYRNQDTPYTTGAWGVDYRFVVSPRANNNIIIDGSGTTPIEYTINPADVSAMTYVGKVSTELVSVGGNGATYFKYAGDALMVVPEVDTNGNVTDVELFNVTNGLDAATEITIEGIYVADEVATYSMAAAAVDNADIDIYLQKDSKVSKYSTKDVNGIFAPSDVVVIDNENGTVTITWTAPKTDLDITYNFYIGDELIASEVEYEEGDELYYIFNKSENEDAVYGVSATYPNGEESAKESANISSVEAVKLSIYPNPTSGTINISVAEDIVSVEIYSITGALVNKSAANSIDISDLAAGTYIIKVNGNAPVRVIKK